MPFCPVVAPFTVMPGPATEVLVITVFTGDLEGSDLSSFAQSLHKEWGGSPQPFALRQAEDSAALTFLGANGKTLDHLDAVYRAAPDGEWLYPDVEAIFGEVHPADPMSLDGSAGTGRAGGSACSPRQRKHGSMPRLAVGHHVDHQIVRPQHKRSWKQATVWLSTKTIPTRRSRERSRRPCPAPEPVAGAWRPSPSTRRTWPPRSLPWATTAVNWPILFGGAEAMPNRVWSFAATRSPQACLAERIWWPEEA